MEYVGLLSILWDTHLLYEERRIHRRDRQQFSIPNPWLLENSIGGFPTLISRYISRGGMFYCGCSVGKNKF